MLGDQQGLDDRQLEQSMKVLTSLQVSLYRCPYVVIDSDILLGKAICD